MLKLLSKTPKQILYFLTGSTPIRITIQRRRLVYLHHILNQNEESLLRTFFEQQLLTRKNKDWASQIIKDLSDFKINRTMDEIRLIKEETWKSIIKSKATENALYFLNSTIGSKSQSYKELKLSHFLSSQSEVPIETAKFIAKVQTHMVENIKMNFQGNFKPNFLCNSCKISQCDQAH